MRVVATPNVGLFQMPLEIIFDLILLFISCLFIFGLIAQEIGLPPLVGFLAVGFSLSAFPLSFWHSFHLTSDFADFLNPSLELLSSFGVLLMLFSIGLKLDIASFLKKEFWLTTFLQTVLMTFSSCLFISFAAFLRLPVLCDLTLSQQAILGFALSFSSTVLVIKILLDRGELHGLSGKISTSILVLQDILAVAYMTFFSSESDPTPSLWSILIFPFLFLVRPILIGLLNRLGHNEMLVLGGVFIALTPGAFLFHKAGFHSELGALTMGVLLASHPRAAEIAKMLFPLKELFLTCYFLQLGIKGIPSIQQCLIALLLLIFLVIKNISFFACFRIFGFRVRTCVLSAFHLTNFSEFGLIVANASEARGMLPSGWSSILVISTALSFLMVKPLEKMLPFLEKIFALSLLNDETNEQLHPSDRLISLGNAQILILGMGRVGSGAYDELVVHYGEIVLGIELMESKYQTHLNEERNVILADATDPDFWDRIIAQKNLDLILLTMSNLPANSIALSHVRRKNFKGRVAAIVDHEDERLILREAGVDAVFNIYSEAGSGFATHLIDILNLDELYPEPEIYLKSEPAEEQIPLI